MLQKLFYVEWVREISTIIMLTCIGIIAGKSFIEKFCYFLFSFGIWDIFYYVGLKAVLNWPESLLTWDVLFLIPLPWIGPVLAPVICSLTMVFLSISLIYIYKKNKVLHRGNLFEWSSIITGTMLIFTTFVSDFTRLIINSRLLNKLSTLAVEPEFANVVNSFVPQKFNWLVFILGEIIIIVPFVIYLFRYRKEFLRNRSLKGDSVYD